MTVSRLLLLIAAVMFLLGAYFPVAIMVDSTPSIQVYGLVLISFPMWIVGAGCAGFVAWYVRRESSGSRTMMWLAWVLVALNSSAFFACLIWQPEGIS